MIPPPHRRALPIVVDDIDPGLVYEGEWSRETPSPGQFNDTVTGTIQVGATISYTFRGQYVQVYGQRLPNGVINSTYTVDDKNPVTYFKQDAVNKKQHQVQFFSSPMLEDGKHTLVITNNGEYLNFDYLQVVVDGTESVGQSLPTRSPFTVPTTSSAPKGQSSGTSDSRVTSTQHPSGGMVATIIILAVFLFTMILAVVVFIVWRTGGRRRSQNLVTPFESLTVATENDVLGPRKTDLLGRDPFRREGPEIPFYGNSVHDMPITLFADDESEHDINAPRPVLLTSAFRRVPPPERVSIISTPVNIAGPFPQRDRAEERRSRSNPVPPQVRLEKKAVGEQVGTRGMHLVRPLSQSHDSTESDRPPSYL